MVALLNKKRSAKPAPDPLAVVESQLTDHRAALLRSRSRLAAVAFELDSLNSRPDQREQQISDLRAELSKAEANERGQEEYCSLLGHSGEEELTRLRHLVATLTQQIAATEAALLLDAKERTRREAELHAERVLLERAIGETDTKIRTLLTVKERLHQERGETIKAECDTLLSTAEQLEQDCVERLTEARRVAQQARADAFQRLEAFPQLRRSLASRHRIREDSTSSALAAMIALLDILVIDGVEVEQCRAGVPMGVPAQMCAEFELELQSLIAAGAGEPHVLAVKRERLVNLLSAYRRSLAQV